MMKSRSMVISNLLAVTLLALAMPVLGAANPLTPRLTRALAAGSAPESVRIWVQFTDKGHSEQDLPSALAAAGDQLDPRTRDRRALRGEGPLVDDGDLPLAADYLLAVQATGATLRQQSRWLNAASFQATRDQIQAIAALPCVVRLDLLGTGHTTRQDPQPEAPVGAQALLEKARDEQNLDVFHYGASYPQAQQLNLPAVHAEGLTGQGVTIALLDTGFDLGHECLQHLDVAATWDFVNGNYHVGPRSDESVYQTVYGTGTLSALAGYSPGNLIGPAHQASVILAKTEDLDSETPVEEDNWIAALEWAEQLGADIVLSSLGYIDWYDFADLDGQSTLITVAAEMAAARGVLVVNAVGDQRGNPDWPHLVPPADGRNVLAVGSIDLYNQVSYLSSPGPTADGRIKPDVMALGHGAAMALSTRSQMYYFGYGTQYASALVGGVAALLLEKNPGLNPAQIRTALRETASRAILPDNDFGWGTVNAAAAGNYWAPVITHEPLPSVEPGGGSFRVHAGISSTVGLDASNLWVSWRREGQGWNMVALEDEGEGQYGATIGAQADGTVVEYYLTAQDTAGLVSRLPAAAPTAVFSFAVATDQAGPEIMHVPLADQTPLTWPPRVFVEASDPLGVTEVSLQYSLLGQPWTGPFQLEQVGDHWEIDFPWEYGIAGPEFDYFIMARDGAEAANFTVAGPYHFALPEHLGRVLVVDDTALAKDGAQPRLPLTGTGAAGEKSADYLVQWLTEAGYLADTMPAAAVGSSSFQGYDAVLVSCGPNFNPLVHDPLRRTMLAWVDAGGRLMVEGGEVAYAAQESPGYPEIMARVLHMASYAGDDASSLRPPQELRHHPLANRPHRLPVPLRVNTSGGMDWSASDLVEAADDARVYLQTDYGSGLGVIAYDDNTCPDGGQIVYLPINLQETFAGDGRALLANTMSYLLQPEPPGSSSVTGRITLVGQDDHSGVTVTAGPNHSAVTAADGSYTITGLWGGRYIISAGPEGYAPGSRTIDLPDGADYPVNLYLLPVADVSYPDAPGLTIPDNDPEGIERTVEVAEQGELVGITVDGDISHFSVGQLVVTLTSPQGTTVTLHNRSGGLIDDLVGTWPTTLFVDGPGELGDFLGEDPRGQWTFHVSDRQFGALGTLNSWSLNLLVKAGSYAPADQDLVPATRLLGNLPNPFNPRTEIAFELAAAGQVKVDIYDIRGRLVRTLERGSYPAGRHTVVWDGRDNHGAEPASGIYFCRFRSGRQAQVLKMTLVR
jgi:serine protease AprX